MADAATASSEKPFPTTATLPAGFTFGDADPPPPAGPPAAPARYEFGEELGRGGMGVVYRARDVVLDRDVAVKTLADRAAGDPAAARRFVEEARITGRLQHPGVPAVHQLGVLPDGRPFLAMKLIRGRTLHDQLKARPDPGSDLGRFVAAFEKVCEAVAYAHAQGVIHRDLKPANVMVGDFGEVQVMDWGLAKQLRVSGVEPPSHDRAEGPTAPEADTATAAGSVLGTPGFMAPEQAGSPGRADERADVFGLGAILCVILTGQPPYAGADADTIHRAVAIGDALARLDRCGADPELAGLCRRCLAADPAGRPRDADEVATAVARLRSAAEDRARQAERDRVAADVRAAEERKRQRAQLCLGGLVVLALAVGVGVSTWQMVRANAEAERANGEAGRASDEAAKARAAEERARAAEAAAVEREAAERKARESAEEVARFMREVFAQGSALGQASPTRGANPRLTVKEAMDFAARNIGGRSRDRPEIEAAVRDTVGMTYMELGANAEARPQLRQALALREAALGPDHLDTLTSVNNLALLLRATGELPAAEPLCERALAGFEKVLGPDHPDALLFAHNLASLLRVRGDLAGAEPLYRRALAGREKALGPDHPFTVSSVNGLGLLLYAKGDLPAAEPLLRRAAAALEKTLGPDHPDTLTGVNNLAGLLYAREDLTGAEALYRRALAGRERALPRGHPLTLSTAGNLGVVLHARGEYAAAEPLLRRTATGLEKALGPQHPEALSAAFNLALLVYDAGRFGEAAPLFEKTWAAYRRRPEGAFAALLCRSYLGLSLLGAGKPAEAEPHLLAGHDGLSRQKALNATNRNRLRRVAAGLVEVYEATNRPAKATEWRARLAALPPEVAPRPRPVTGR